jgi:hypothetical protein
MSLCFGVHDRKRPLFLVDSVDFTEAVWADSEVALACSRKLDVRISYRTFFLPSYCRHLNFSITKSAISSVMSG